MIIGIHPDGTIHGSYSEKWSKFLGQHGVEVKILNLLAPDALEQARKCDGVMWRWTHTPHYKQSAQRIMFTLEHYLGIPVFPNWQTVWHYDEKIAQCYLLELLGAPTPRTWLFWDRDQALAWARRAPYPVLFKLSSGANSANVLKVENEAAAVALIKRCFGRGIFPYTMNEFSVPSRFPRSLPQLRALGHRMKDGMRFIVSGEYPILHSTWWKPEHGYVYFQEFVHGNNFDTRITVIGDRAFCYRRMNRPNDFRASGSGNFDVDPEGIDHRCIEVAFQVSKYGRFQSMAYDFLFKNGDPVICEISYTFVDWMVQKCPGHWDSNLNWIEGQMWPEEALVEDFLNDVLHSKES